MLVTLVAASVNFARSAGIKNDSARHVGSRGLCYQRVTVTRAPVESLTKWRLTLD